MTRATRTATSQPTASPQTRAELRRGARALPGALVLLCAAAAPAAADTLEIASPGARNIASGGGYLVWAAPSEDGGWRLVARGPDSVVRTLPIASFGAAPDPAIGSRVAYAYNSSRGGGLAVRRLSGEGNVLTPATRRSSVPRSIELDRYRATWLVGETAFQTDRLTRARTTRDVVVLLAPVVRLR